METRFRILQIARSNELHMYEDPNEYDIKEIRQQISSLKYLRTISAFGIVGFVRFLENYYLILVTKRNKVGFIGNHIIYTIKDTTIFKITPETKSSPSPLESKYLKMFMNVDLSSNFYFSYSYDLTRTLQYNMAQPKFVGDNVDISKEEPLTWDDSKEERMYAYRSSSRKKFVWNDFLLQPMRKKVLYKDWMLELIHGFVNQSSISIYGLPIYVMLIARRSKIYAGTRFLKRGANSDGDVANEVESEQIVTDGHKISSFVQMRGSIPAHWSQDISKMVPKPPISLDIPDPFAETAGKHFEKLLFHYGAPLIVLNLVKRKEKRRHESILTTEIMNNVEYLNQFLPSNCKIKYTHFDMARKNRLDKNVMGELDNKGKNAIALTGIFYTDQSKTFYQTGIIRTNCVDCLDRTNTAQFAMGRCALAHQLHKMGLLKADSKLEFDSDCVTMLESLYEIHGDTLALQYGGSQLVHRIKTYRKTAAWTSQGNDIMQTLSRYLSNTFSDQEKQQSINLFLGLYIPYENEDSEQLWDMTNDYNLHNPVTNIITTEKPLTMWYSDVIRKNLPYSTSIANKVVKELIRIHTLDLEMIDLYSNYHLTYKLTSLEENIAFQISQFTRTYMPAFRTNFSPFVPTKRTQPPQKTPPQPDSNSSSDPDTTSDEDDTCSISRISLSDQQKSEKKSFFDDYRVKDSKKIYGFELEHPDKESMTKYKSYVNFQRKSHCTAEKSEKKSKPIILEPLNTYTDSAYEIEEPQVTDEDRKKYENYCKNIINPNYDENYEKDDIIEKYINFSFE